MMGDMGIWGLMFGLVGVSAVVGWICRETLLTLIKAKELQNDVIRWEHLDKQTEIKKVR